MPYLIPDTSLDNQKSKKVRWAIIALLALVFITFLTLQTSLLSPFFSSTPSGVHLADVTAGSNLEEYRRARIYADNPAYIEVMGGGVAIGDVDGDGWEDLFFAGMPTLDPDLQPDPSPSALFRNQGDGTFREITDEAGLDDIQGFPMGALFFDFNNNGRQDLYVTSYDGGQLFRNDGGTFTDVTDPAGVALDGLCGELPCLAAAASAADYDRDGFLDLLIVNNVGWDISNPGHYGRDALLPFLFEGQRSILFRNNGDGTFSDVTGESGIRNFEDSQSRTAGKGLSSVWTDINRDGWPDLYIANDMSPSRLYLNRSDGTFSEIGRAAGVDEIKSSMGVDAADYNLDGHFDLVVTNLVDLMTTLYRNRGDLRFDNNTIQSGLLLSGRSSGWGILFSDLDLDGFPDLVMGSGQIWNEPDEAENLFFRNRGNGTFEDVTSTLDIQPNDQITRGLAVLDLNRSGKPDLIFSNIDGSAPQLLENRSSGNHWLRVDLEGVNSNRNAVGATVILEREDGHTRQQMVKAGNSYVSSGSKSLFFGLGSSAVHTLTIQWPSGQTDTLEAAGIKNKILRIREGEGVIEGGIENR
ncbi:MAG: CRTAC1 family protein [Balneolaceae bacterium]